jgi:hypothetical protein
LKTGRRQIVELGKRQIEIGRIEIEVNEVRIREKRIFEKVVGSTVSQKIADVIVTSFANAAFVVVDLESILF